MKTLTADHCFYAFSAHNAPALSVASGEQLLIETQDCFSGQIRGEDDDFSAVGWDRVNPATGPVFVVGAQPGDVLVAHVLEIEPAGHGMMTAVPGLGALGDSIAEAQTKVIPIKGGTPSSARKQRYRSMR